MAIPVICPECDKRLQVADNLAGRRIKCPQCAALITVSSSGEEDLPVVEAVEERPPTPKAPKKTMPRAAVTTQKAVVPKKVAAVAPKRRRDDDDDEEEDYEAPEKKSSMGLFIAIGVIAAVVLIGGGVGAALLLSSGKKDKGTPVALQPPVPSFNKTPNPDDDQGSKPHHDDPPLPPGQGYSPAEVHQRLLKSTVWIVNTEQIRVGNQVGTAISSGSGVLVYRDPPLILTNFHVVHDIPDNMVIFPAYKKGEVIPEPKYYGENAASLGIKGKVVARDPGHDVALIQLESVPSYAQVVRFAPKPPKSGANVHSIGNSGVNLGTGGGTLWRYTPGQVRSVYEHKWNYPGGQRVESSIVETNSPTNPGDSGGPVVNDRVELIAIVSGGDPSKQLVSLNIDVRELRAFLKKYFEQSGKKWEEQASTAPPEQQVDAQTHIRKLSDPDSRERLKAILALGEMGTDGQAAVPRLIPLLKDSDPSIRKAASGALDQIGPPAKADFLVVLQALKSPSSETRLYAARTVANSGIGDVAPPDALPFLTAALKDNDAGVRKNVVSALGNLGPAARGAIADLLDKLKDSDAVVRRNAAQAVTRVGVEGKGSVPILIELLKERNVETRRASAMLLAKLGPDGKEAAPALAEALKDPDPLIRRSALDGLAQYGADAKPAVPALREILRGKAKDKTLQQSAIDVLTQLGPDAKEAIPDLVEALEDPLLRDGAVTALGKMGKLAVPDLKNALKDNSAKLRTGACMALGEIGADAKETVFLLSSLQRDPNPTVRDAASDALRKVQRKK
jgi:HEAT repeat protein/S1-C subfamily serine protease